MRWGMAALALVGLAGCATGPRDFIIGDESFTTSERSAIERGAAFVAHTTGRPVPEIIWGPLPGDDEDMTIVRRPLVKRTLGTCIEGHFQLELDPVQNPKLLAETTAHEMGHALGLEHLDASVPGLMNPTVPRSLLWTEADQDSCTKLGVCAR